MKYIIGASIGGLFGLSLPMMIATDEKDGIVDEVPRVEEFQPAEEDKSTPIGSALLLPDNSCGYFEPIATNPKEQAKECLQRIEASIPAI